MRNILLPIRPPALVFIIWMSYAATSQAQDIVSDYQKFITAHTEKKYADCIQAGEPLVKFSGHPGLQYKLAECYCQTGQLTKSLDILGSLAARGMFYNVKENKGFSPLYTDKRFIEYAETFTKNNAVIDKSVVSFVIRDSLFIPEGMAYDQSRNTFFIGSLSKHKVIKCVGGNCTEFVNGKDHGFWMALGMKVSPDAKSLWICSASEKDSTNGYSGIFQFDINSGKLLQKFITDNKNGPHLFNDIVIAKSGDVYFTDSKAGKLWRIFPGDDTLTEYGSGYIYPNGIAEDEEKKNLFVADFTGLSVIDLATGKRTQLSHGGKTFLNGIDGLYFYKGSLIAIQDSGNQDDRIARFYYDLNKMTITKVEVLQTSRPDFIIPTTGAMAKGELHYISNSQLRSLQPDGSITNPEKLVNPVILKLKVE
jgi:hypothetical protein